MIDGDAIKPRAPGSLAAELIHLAKGLEKNIVRGVLGFLGVAEKAEREIENRAAMLGVKVGELRRRPAGLRLVRTLAICHGLVHERFQWRLDNTSGRMSRWQNTAH